MKCSSTSLLCCLWLVSSSSVPVTAALAAPPSKVESAAISRFQRFDKLCKTCPTLIQPRVETLTEMILGLSPDDREQLQANVAQRLAAQQEEEADSASANGMNANGMSTINKPPIQTVEDVYKFQTGADAVKLTVVKKKDKKVDVTGSNNGQSSNNNDKVLGKMDKLRSKFESNKYKHSQVQALLDQTNRLLSSSQQQQQESDTAAADADAVMVISQITDPTVLHGTEELQAMNRAELKLQRLKYMAQKSKYEQKMAKARVKLYRSSLQLAVVQRE